MASPGIGTETSISIVGPTGPVEVGTASSCSFNLNPKQDSVECMDGIEYTRDVGPRPTGTIKRPYWDGAMIAAVKAQMVPGSDIKYQVITVLPDGTSLTFVNCHLTLSIEAPDGIVQESVDFKAERVM